MTPFPNYCIDLINDSLLQLSHWFNTMTSFPNYCIDLLWILPTIALIYPTAPFPIYSMTPSGYPIDLFNDSLLLLLLYLPCSMPATAYILTTTQNGYNDSMYDLYPTTSLPDDRCCPIWLAHFNWLASVPIHRVLVYFFTHPLLDSLAILVSALLIS
jgi:hypothetical protein